MNAVKKGLICQCVHLIVKGFGALVTIRSNVLEVLKMSNDNTCEYKRIKIPEKAKGLLTDMQYSSRLKILETKFGEKYNNKETKSVFKVDDLQRSLRNLRNAIEKDIPTITEEDLHQLEDILLVNASSLETNEN